MNYFFSKGAPPFSLSGAFASLGGGFTSPFIVKITGFLLALVAGFFVAYVTTKDKEDVQEVGDDDKLETCDLVFKENSFEEILNSDRYWRIIEKVRTDIDVHKECYANCRTHSCNNFLWDAKEKAVDNELWNSHGGAYAELDAPPPHVNFV